MLSENTASRVFATSPEFPRVLLPNYELDDDDFSFYSGADNIATCIVEAQGNLVLHLEADDIAAYIVDAPAISFAKAIVTHASDASMSKPIGHSVFVLLRVLSRAVFQSTCIAINCNDLYKVKGIGGCNDLQ